MLPTLPVVLLEPIEVLRPATAADSRGVVTEVPRVDDVLPDDVATFLRGELTVALCAGSAHRTAVPLTSLC